MNLNFAICFYAWDLGNDHDIYKHENVGKYINLSNLT